MDLQAFDSQFDSDSPRSGQDFVDFDTSEGIPQSLVSFRHLYAGRSFSGGLYHVMDQAVYSWSSAFIATAFPTFSDQTIPFSYDWLGRIFAVDLERNVSGDSAVVMFEPGTGQALDIPANLETFHNDELIAPRNEALADLFFLEWRTAGGRPPTQKECVGYKQPLFLNGQDNIQNLELTDIDVYWELSAQIISQTRGLPPGTRIDFRGSMH